MITPHEVVLVVRCLRQRYKSNKPASVVNMSDMPNNLPYCSPLPETRWQMLPRKMCNLHIRLMHRLAYYIVCPEVQLQNFFFFLLATFHTSQCAIHPFTDGNIMAINENVFLCFMLDWSLELPFYAYSSSLGVR